MKKTSTTKKTHKHIFYNEAVIRVEVNILATDDTTREEMIHSCLQRKSKILSYRNENKY